MRIFAHAKINWTLGVTSRRSDGYHELDMLMQSVSLCDTLDITPAQSITCEGPPLGSGNLALRAAKCYFAHTGIAGGVHIRLEKRIPAGAGLGGGSADAAGVLLALEKLYAPLNDMGRHALALSLGADVPFCLAGGLARVSGIGDNIQPLPSPRYALLLVKPQQSVSTAALFASLSLPCAPVDNESAQQALLLGDAHKLAPCLHNALEPAAVAICPEIADIKAWLSSHGALGASMSGSGSCVFGLYATINAAETARALVPSQWFCAACHTLPNGIQIRHAP